jgi:DnaJ-class molecular chaperone
LHAENSPSFEPDKNKSPEATESFKEVATAYAILSDPDKKRQYDAHGYDVRNRS